MDIKLNPNETGVVKRGKLRGETVKVIARNEEKSEYAVTVETGASRGEFAIVAASNFRTPEEPTVQVRSLAGAFTDLGMVAGGSVSVDAILGALDSASPGISDHIGIANPVSE